MAETFRPVVIERREAQRRLDLRDAPDRRLGERRDLGERPADLRADDVLIDLPSSRTSSRSWPGAGSCWRSSGR
jgi:hypothetical protein